MRFFRIAISTIVCLANLAFAGDAPNHYEEPGLQPGRDYINQHFGEHIDPLSGSLQLQYVDLFLPGNGGFDIRVVRSYNLRKTDEYYSPFGRGWDIHFGRIRNRADQTSCNSSNVQTMMIELPDGSLQTLYKSNSVPAVPNTLTSDFVTTQLWKAKCHPSLSGLIVYSPDGSQYDMTRRTTRSNPQAGFWLVEKITDRNGNFATFTYEDQPSSGRAEVKTVTTSDGRIIAFNYVSGRLTSITSNGRTWNYNVSGNNGSYNTLNSMTPPVGAAWQYTYFADRGLLAGGYALQTVTYPQGGTITYNYGFVTFLQGVINAAQSTVVTNKVTTDGTWTFAYAPSFNGSDDTTTVTLPGALGTITYKHYGYNTNGQVWQIGLLKQKITGSVQTETFNWSDSLVISEENITRPGYMNTDINVKKPLLSSSVVNRNGQTYTTAFSGFDAYGNPTVMAETGNKSRTYSGITYFDPTSKWIIGLKKDEPLSGIGSILKAYNAANGNLSSMSRYGVITGYTYDADGSVNAKTDPRGFRTTYSSYFRGIPQSEIRAVSTPEAVTIARTVDYFGNVTSETDGMSSWGYGYDGLNRITSVDFPTGTDATITWTNTTRVFTRGPLIETRNFDGYSRPTSTVRAGITTTYDFDPLSRKTFESYPDGGTNGVTQSLDLLGRVKNSVSPAGTRTISYSGNDVAVQNERLISTTYSYDRYGDPDGGFVNGVVIPNTLTTTLVKNAIGLTNSVTQGTLTRGYGYFANFYLQTITDPETGATTFGRDNNGNMISKSIGGVSSTYEYDGLDRLKKATHTDSAGIVAYVYNNRSQLTSVTNPSGLREYDYDANGNMKLDKLTVDGNIFSTDYTYDLIDGLNTIKYPLNNRMVTFNPTSLGRPTTVSPYLSAVNHRSSGNLNYITYANGVTMNFGENARQLPTIISSAPLSMTYDYDGVGNVAFITNNSVPADSKTMCYDEADRLKSTSAGCAPMFDYDTKGNLTKNGSTNYTYDTGNRLATTTGMIPRTFSTDTRGRITGYGGKSFAFDDASQLKCVNCNAAGEIKYAYDGKGQRIWQEKGGKRIYFVQAPNGDLLLEYTPTGKLWKEHAYLHGKRIASHEGSNALPPTLSVSANPGAGEYGQSITFTATIGGGATGSIQFLDGTSSLGSANIVGTQATLAVSTLFAAAHTITAKYAGDANFAPVDASVAVNISKATQTVSFTVIPAKVATDMPFTATATASSALAVSFASGNPGICTTGGINGVTVTLTGNAGTCVLDARQAGDSNYFAASVVTQSFQIARASPTLSLYSSNVNEVVGQVVTLTSTLSGASLQTGTITLTDGGAVINSLAVQAGTASYSYGTNVLAPGLHSLQATYSGDANNATSTSNVVTQTISKQVSVATCSASAPTILNTVNLTFTVGITGNAPTGTVTISENGITLATATLSSGSASAVFKLQSPGLHSISATYSGDGAHLPSTCTAVPVQSNFDPALLIILFSDDE